MKRDWIGNLKNDLLAGLVVFFVAIPLCLGIAHASGAPLLSGLVSGIVGGVVVGILSKSPLSVSGPAAGLTAITIGGIQELGAYEAFLVAVVLAGLIQIVLGVLRAGLISKFIPHCVINGMLAAIGLILIFKQLPHLLGYDVEMMGVEEFSLRAEDISDYSASQGLFEQNTLTTIWHAFKNLNPTICTLGLGSLFILFLWDIYIPQKVRLIPGSVIVVFFSTILSLVFSAQGISHLSEEHFVNIPAIDSWNMFMMTTKIPDWSMISNPKVILLSITIALVASIETLLSVEAVDRLDPRRRTTPTNRELIAQGLGNALSGSLGGLPVTSVIVRSSVNVSAGAQTKISCISHGLFILLGLVFFSVYLNYIPLAGLAAVLVYTGYKLSSPKILHEQYKQGLDQFIPSLVTTLAILFTDILIGVGIGLIVSALFIVGKSYQASSFIVEDHGLKKSMILGESIHFLHKYKIVKFLNEIPANTILEIDASKTIYIDHDIEEAIKDFKAKATQKNINVIYGGLVNKFQNRRKIMEANKEAYNRLIENNKEWVAEKLKMDPGYFEELMHGQAPEFLFIGCSDSRVPAEDVTKCKPGEMFVHRNVANLVLSTDVNVMSVLQYAVEVLNVKHIILCGHYECGGIKSAMDHKNYGLINQWLMSIKDVYRLHQQELDEYQDEDLKYRRLVELNAIEQAYNLVKIPFVQKQRALYGFPEVHAWAYDIKTGLINDLKLDETIISNSDSIYSQH
jgi:carbonic anhydrase